MAKAAEHPKSCSPNPVLGNKIDTNLSSVFFLVWGHTQLREVYYFHDLLRVLSVPDSTWILRDTCTMVLFWAS